MDRSLVTPEIHLTPKKHAGEKKIWKENGEGRRGKQQEKRKTIKRIYD